MVDIFLFAFLLFVFFSLWTISARSAEISKRLKSIDENL